ncbi:uncharacterized protein LOC113215195 [Frankliniella occidentalis]|uniref:Uncharacterized protein LOC113215195 n=1 Tax=Frankliniella occidentalis TaxID=133901 RepID=A0A6J1TCU5_FRAOC|nr:uncharacterized protein LOC113215195 [Frankliniella occidentalis]
MRLIVVGDCVKLQHRTHIPPAPNKNSSIDRKGIKRGACEEDGCTDCDSYYHDPQKGSQCQYCGCFPTKHRKIDEPTDDLSLIEKAVREKSFPPQRPEIHIIDDGSSSMVYEVDDDGTITIPDDEDEPGNILQNQTGQQDSCSLPNLLSTRDMNKVGLPMQRLSGNLNKENTPQKPSSATFTSLTSHLPREELYEFCVPTNLPNLPAISSKGERIDRGNHIFVLRWISWSMCNFKLATEKDYTEVAKLTMKKYPELVSAIPSDKKDVAAMVQVLKDLLQKHSIEKQSNHQGTNKRPNAPGPKPTKPVPRTESIRISNNFSTVNVVSSVSSVKTTSSNPAKPSATIAAKPAPAPAVFVSSKQFENCKAHIQKEMRKVGPSLPMLQTFLSSIRKDRLILAKGHSYATHIEEFPCLEIPEIVLWEFIQQEQLKCSLEDFKNNWVDVVPQMVEYFLCGSNDQYTYDSKTVDLVTMEILQTISTPVFFGREQGMGRPPVTRSSHVLEVFQDNILPLFVFPQRGDPPRLFSLGGSDEVYVYVDGQSIYSGPILDALMFLVAVYHVFSITPAHDAQASFAFVFGIFMKEKGIDQYVMYKSAHNALKAILNL